MLTKKFLSIIALFLISTLNLAFLSSATAADPNEILPYKEAYKISVTPNGRASIKATWEIVDKHLMYKDKFKFSSDTPGVVLGQPVLPPSKTKEGIRPDGSLGPIEIYTNRVTMDIPILQIDPGVTQIKFVAKSQGCNDIICYPPNTQRATVTVAQAAPAKTSSGGVSAFQNLTAALGLGSAANSDMMTSEQAFQFSSEIAKDHIVTRWKVADGTYLYQKNISFKSDNPNVKIGNVAYPKADSKNDPLFGNVKVYHRDIELALPLIVSKVTTRDTKIKVTYQGCSDTLGICYPPDFKEVFLPAGLTIADGSNFTSVLSQTTTSDTPKEQVSFNEFLGYVALAFAIGLGLTFTPCVLPMIPILSSIIIGQGDKKLSKTKGGILAAIYVLGTSVVYTITGWWAGASGDQLQAYFQLPWVISTFAALLFLLAMSMFGLFEIQMPSAIQSRMQQKSASLKGGTYAGVFVMGILSSLIVGACASPLLLSVLGIAMTTQDPVLGAAIMFSMSMGMGVFLIAFGIGASALVPKAGSWMNDVKYAFGILLIGVAIYLLQAVPDAPVLYLWAILFIVTAVYMRATQAIPDGSNGWKVLGKGIATVLLIWGVLALLGAMMGGRDILSPIPVNSFAPGMSGGFTQAGGSSANSHSTLFTQFKNLNELDAKLAEAKQAGKPVIIDYYADWCQDCLRMEKTTFIEPEVINMLNNDFVALQVDVTDQFNKESKATMKRYGIFAPPAILFFNSKGEQLEDLKLYGYKSKDEFIELLNSVKLR